MEMPPFMHTLVWVVALIGTFIAARAEPNLGNQMVLVWCVVTGGLAFVHDREEA